MTYCHAHTNRSEMVRTNCSGDSRLAAPVGQALTQAGPRRRRRLRAWLLECFPLGARHRVPRRPSPTGHVVRGRVRSAQGLRRC